jgi:ABC-2 type transport system ATP-binding protein
MDVLIEAEKLTKVYPGGVLAVDHIDLSVKEGEIFGFLGPNGAGKTSTIMMLVTLSHPTEGRALIAGWDVVHDRSRVRSVLGYVSQDIAVDEYLTGWENTLLQGKLYHLSIQEIKNRGREVLEMVDLWERKNDLVQTYSGGMRKRLDIACGLIHRPRILFLDEPTLGLDIQTRSRIWEYIRRLRSEHNMTIFLTTHYMDEADKLCDRIAIIDRGKLMALGTPLELKHSVGGDLVTIQFAENGNENKEKIIPTIRQLPFVESVKEKDSQLLIVTKDGNTSIPLILSRLHDIDTEVASISMKRPSLDDVFLFYTGRQLRDEEASAQDFYRMRRAIRRAR